MQAIKLSAGLSRKQLSNQASQADQANQRSDCIHEGGSESPTGGGGDRVLAKGQWFNPRRQQPKKVVNLMKVMDSQK